MGASNNISLDTLTPTTTSIRIGDTIIDRLYTIAIVTSNSSNNSFTAVTIQAGEFETVNGTVMAEYAHRAILDGNANNIANTYANKGAQNIWTAEQKQELSAWYQAWLDAPQTNVVPAKPAWLDGVSKQTAI